MLSVINGGRIAITLALLFAAQMLHAQTVNVPDKADSLHRLGVLVETYSYSQLMYDRVGIGGYFGAVTYRVLPAATLGLGYDYSVYNHSVLLDIRQEVNRARLRPVLIAGVGYALSPTKQTITSSFGIQQAIESQRGLVYRAGVGLRAYYFKKLPIAINAGLSYKNEPGYTVTETKSGGLINAYQNVGSFCLSVGLSY